MSFSRLQWGGFSAGVGLAIFSAFGTSIKAVLVKLAYAYVGVGGIEAITLLTLRLGLALPIFLLVALRESRKVPALSLRDWLLITLLGMIGHYGSSLFDFIGLRYISAGLERLILFTYPTLTVLIGILFFGKHLHRRELAALLLSYAGIAAAFMHDLNQAGNAKDVWTGAAFVFAASLGYACYLVGIGRMISRLGVARFTALVMVMSTLITLIHFLLAQPLVSLVLPWQVYLLALLMALISTVLPTFALSAAIHAIGSSRTALIGSFGPLITIYFGWLLLGEAISAAQIAGAVLVVAGVLLVSSRGKVEPP